MPAKTSLTDFEALVRRAGIALPAEEIAEIYKGWGSVEQMLLRNRGHGRDRSAEPAPTFDPAAFGTGTP